MTTYIIKSSLSLLLLFGLYWFLLRKEKLFVFNRFFLVASVVCSLLVPFISIPVNFQNTPRLENFIPTNNQITPETVRAESFASDSVISTAAIPSKHFSNSISALHFRCNIVTHPLYEKPIFSYPKK